MTVPHKPENESLRLQALHYYDILDTAAEKDFDDIVELASQLCETPISLVSLIDSDRQWFKARHGMEAHETPRDIAFCAMPSTRTISWLFTTPPPTRASATTRW